MDDINDEELEISYFSMIWTVVASVGWYIAVVIVGLWYASPYIRDKYTKWKLKKDEQDYAAKYHKNPDLLQERLSALEASRQKMQEEYSKKCMLTQGEGKEARKKDSSRLIDVKHMDCRQGDKAKDVSCSTEKKSKSIRGDYNPLMGDGSRGYRPPKRSCCKGSCG